MKAILNLLFLYFFIVSPTKIHILDLSVTKREAVTEISGNSQSRFTKICEKVLRSYNFMGRNSLDIYQYCGDKYELLSKNNTLIREDSPFCFNNLNEFFCKYSITELKSKRKELANNYRTCADKNALKLILSIIKGCITDQLNGVPKEKMFNKCPSLDIQSFKITDKVKFCDGAEQKEVFVGKDRKSVEYYSITSNYKNNCLRVVDMYNTCIDSDNILFPHSNYRKCFSEFHSLYTCSYVEKYNINERDICSNFVLPSLAYVNLKKNIFGSVPKYYCEGFENTILKNHDEKIAELASKQQALDEKISEIDKVTKNNRHLESSTNYILKEIVKFNKLWNSFYSDLTNTYKTRKNLYPSEFVILNKMRISFDRFYPYAAQLNSLTKDKKFLSADFGKLFDSFKAYYDKIYTSIEDTKVIIGKYDVLLKKMLNKQKVKSTVIKAKGIFSTKIKSKTIMKPTPTKIAKLTQKEEKTMISQVLDHKEIISFQNQYVSIQLYVKNFLSYVMKTIRQTNSKNEDSKFKYLEEIEKYKKMIGFLTHQKQKIFEYILE